MNNNKSNVTPAKIDDPEYVRLVSRIDVLWNNAREHAAIVLNNGLLDASWQTGEYIVKFEQDGKEKAKYGERLLENLSRDLTLLKGKGFSRSRLTYMRKFYLAFPICATVSHKLTWSHYVEILKCEDSLELQFYMKECEKENWSVFAKQRRTAVATEYIA